MVTQDGNRHVSGPENGGFRIVIIDDDRAIAEGLARILLSSPTAYRVEIVVDPTKALEVVAGFRPDLLILDAVMPGDGGIELCAQIVKAAEASPDPLPKIILFSGYPVDETSGCKADLFLAKPVDRATLLSSIDSLLKESPTSPTGPTSPAGAT